MSGVNTSSLLPGRYNFSFPLCHFPPSVDVASGHVRTIVTGEWIAQLDSVSHDLTKAAGVLSSPAAPGEVHLFDLTTGRTEPLTEVNPQTEELELAEKRRVSWASQDGLAVDGLLCPLTISLY